MPAVTHAADAVDRGALIAEGRTAQVYALGDDRVVKVLRTGFPDAQGKAEELAAKLADGAAIGAPAFFGTMLVDERFGLVYERIEGESMLAQLSARTASIGSLATTLGTLHAAMHQAPGQALPPFRAAIEAAVAGSTRHAGKRAVSLALRRLRGLPDGTAICHGDFHPGNVMMSASGPRVIDWLTASSGSPAADVARTLFILRHSHVPREIPPVRRLRIALLRRRFVAGYLDSYRRQRALDLGEVRAWRLPTLVARLDEDIEQERDHIRRLIDGELSRALERPTG
jgi:aminoglycoside phosphotransferase (APT) family kinase protein